MKFAVLFAALLATGAAGSAGAAVTVRSVAIENAGFDQDRLTDGTYFRTSLPGWSLTSNGAGIFNPLESAGYQPTSGENLINLDTFRFPGDTSDSSLSQQLGETVTEGVRYALSVDVIRRDDFDMAPWFAELYTIDSGVAQILAQGTLGDADVTSGGNKTLTVSYLGTAADAGKTMNVRFRSVYDGQQTPFRQTLVDTVRMTASTEIAAAVPEPATWAMMLVGFGMIGLSSRRHRRPTTVAA